MACVFAEFCYNYNHSMFSETQSDCIDGMDYVSYTFARGRRNNFSDFRCRHKVIYAEKIHAQTGNERKISAGAAKTAY